MPTSDEAKIQPQGAGNPPPAHDSSPGAQGSSSAGAPQATRANKDADKPKAAGQPGYAGEEVALAAGRTNWPDDPDRHLPMNFQSAAGHRPPTLAKDPTAPVYVPGDPNTLVPGEADSGGRAVKPTPMALPDAGDEDYMVRPEPALDDIPRHGGRSQEAAALEQANSELRESVITRDPDAGKGELTAEKLGETGDTNGKLQQPRTQAVGKAPATRPATRQPTRE